MENLFLLLIAIVSIAFVWLIWARQKLTHHHRSFQRRETLLRRDLQKRRDMVPLLLESFRMKHEITPQWTDLMDRRKSFHKPGQASMHEEEEFEQALLAFVESYDVTDVTYLETEKHIKNLTQIIERAKKEWSVEHNRFLSVKRKAPFSLVAKIFAIR